MSYGKLETGPRYLREAALTPYCVSVAFLIREYFVIRSKDPDMTADMSIQYIKDADTSITAKHRYTFAVLFNRLIKGPQVPFCDLFEILVHVWYELPEVLWIRYFWRMKALLEGDESIVTELAGFVRNVSTMLSREPNPQKFVFLSSSPVGVLFRKIVMVHNALDLSEAVEFRAKLYEYVCESMDVIDLVRSSIVDEGTLPTFECCKEHPSGVDFLKSCDIRYSLEALPEWNAMQAAQFAKTHIELLIANDRRSLPPCLLKNILDIIIRCCPSSRKAYICSYFDAVHSGNFNRAEDELHRSSDFVAGEAVYQNPCSRFDPRDPCSRAFRVASMNSAAMHTHFKHRTDALAGVLESLREARRANDVVALQRAAMHMWDLCDGISMERAEDITVKLLEMRKTTMGVDRIFKIIRSGMLKLLPPKTSFQLLREAELISTQEGILAKVVHCQAYRCALWSLIGKFGFPSLMASAVLNVEQKDSRDIPCLMRDETFAAMVTTKAYELFRQGRTDLCWNVLDWLADTFASGGRADAELGCAWTWTAAEAYVTYKELLKRGKWIDALEKARCYMGVRPLHGQYLEAEAYMYAGMLQKSLVAVGKLIIEATHAAKSKCPGERASVIEAAHVLTEAHLLKCQLHCVAQEPHQAMFSLGEAISLAQQNRFCHLTLLALLHMANIQSLLGLPRRSLEILKHLEAIAYSNYDCDTVARLDYLRAKIISRQILNLELPDPLKLEECRRCLIRAIGRFQLLGDKVRERHATILKGAVMFVQSGEEACCEVAGDFGKLEGLSTSGMRLCPDALF